jgi:hypothetical protein
MYCNDTQREAYTYKSIDSTWTWSFVTDAHTEHLLMEDTQVRSLNLLNDAASKLRTEQSRYIVYVDHTS